MPHKLLEDKDMPLVGSKLKAESLFESYLYKDSFDFPYNPDPLVPGNNYDIYDEMVMDDQVKVALALKKDMVVNSGWTIICENKKVADFVTQNLEHLSDISGVDTSFEDVLRDMLSSYAYGFSLTEPIYKLVNGKYYYIALKTRPPHGFRFVIDSRGNVLRIEQSTSEGEKSYKTGLFLHHVYQQEFGNPFGKSDLQAAHSAWAAKKFIMRFLNIYIERFASATVVGMYPTGFDPGQISTFQTILETIQQSTAIAVPEGSSIDFKQPQRDGSDSFLKTLYFYNLQIARAILVPDLLGISGEQTSGGSYALGSKHLQLFMSTIEKDRKSLARKITLRLVQPLVKANFGSYDCRFEFQPFSREAEGEFLKIWVEAVRGRIYKPSEEEVNYFRNKLGFPEGEVELLDPVPAAQRGLNLNGDLKEFKEHTIYEKKMDFAAIEKFLDASERDIVPDLISVVDKMTNDMVDQMKEKNIISNFKPERISEIKIKFEKELNNVFSNYFKTLFKESKQKARKELFPNGEKKLTADDLLPDEFLEILRAETFKLVGDITLDILKRGENHIIKGIKDGLSENDVIRAVRQDIKDHTQANIATVVRTKTTEIYNSARKTYWDTDPIAKEFVVAFQYSAILDERTTAVCSSLNGNIYEHGDYINQITPPLHFNAIMEGELVKTREGQKKIEDVRKGDYVLTHMGRWNRVYDAMSKENDDFDYVLEILTKSGYIRLTPDHPVLTNGRWLPAGCLRVGDEVFKTSFNADFSYSASNRASEDSKNSIALTNEPSVSFNVGYSSVTPSSFFVKLYNQFTRRDYPISNIWSYRNLKLEWYTPVLEKLREYKFRFGRMIPKIFCNIFRGFYSIFHFPHRIISNHSYRTFSEVGIIGFSESQSPMFESRPLTYFFKGDSSSFLLTPCLNSKLSAAVYEGVNATQTKGPCDASERFAFTKMALLDHGLDEFGTVDVHTYNYNVSSHILSIRKIPYLGRVYNLAVENDESYIVNNIVVHNCRSVLVPITKFEDYTSSKEVSFDELKAKGGNLILKGNK